MPRQDPRPQYVSAQSGQKITITYEFESYLLSLTDAGRSGLISRLRKAIQGTNKSRVTMSLAQQALDIEASNAGALKQELSVTIGDFEAFETDTLESELAELQMIVTGVSEGLALPVFRFHEAQYSVIYNALARDEITGGGDAQAVRTELSSWIDVIQRYM